MGLLKKLTNEGSTLSEFDGATPTFPDFKASRRHFTYSINGDPALVDQPNPSQLDLNGATPERYLDNPPE